MLLIRKPGAPLTLQESTPVPVSLPVFVINLKQSTERRQQIEEQLSRLGLIPTFVEAVNGYELLEKQILACYAGIRRRLFYGRDLTAGEIGCLLSHRSIYRRMMEEDIAAAIILEDDVILSDDFPAVVRSLLACPVGWDLVRFLCREKVYKRTRILGDLIEGYKLGRPWGKPGGAYAYILKHKAAIALNNGMHKNWKPVDTLHGEIWNTGLRTFSVLPSPAYYDDSADSTIGDARFDKSRKLKSWEKVLYPFTRFGMKIYELVTKNVSWAVTWPADKARSHLLRTTSQPAAK